VAFLEGLTAFHSELLKRIFIFIASTTDDEKEVNRARNHAYVTDFLNKPFSAEKFKEIMSCVQLAIPSA
jgi:response regulator RpfG family c-di-GMP phosphodiesterase